MRRNAFTMMELIFVIVVLGILATVATPRFHADPLAQAAEEVASRIRYTQHLAMVDDQYDPTDETWYKTRWQIRFLSNGATRFYEIFSDKDKLGGSDESDEAIDPLTHERLGSGNTINTPTGSVNLTQKYGISEIGGTCVYGGTNKLGFDYLGRPFLRVSGGVYDDRVPAAGCTIVLQHSTEGNATIKVEAETGYVSISY